MSAFIVKLSHLRGFFNMHSGRCQCGEIRYESLGEPKALYICHCRECQKQSASAFGISLDVPRDTFRVIQGRPKFWTRITGTGKKLKCAFCPTCGSRLWHELDPATELVSIKAGSLDEPIDVSNAIHVWIKRKFQGILIPNDARQFLEED